MVLAKEDVEALRGLSPATQGVIVAVALSILYLGFALLRSVLLFVARIFGGILPRRSQQPHPRESAADSLLPSPSPAAAKSQHKPGVSIKQLLKDSAKAKHSAGADRHASSALFLGTLRGHTDSVGGLSWSADGSALATACEDRSVRLFSLADLSFAKAPAFRSKALRRGPVDVAFVDDARHVAVMTKGVVDAAGLEVLDFGTKGEPATVWERDGVHSGAPGLCLVASESSKGGYSVVASCSVRTDVKVYSSRGSELGSIDTGGLENYMAAISRDGRWVAAATFTSDVKIYEVTFDRGGAFAGLRKAMDLKGHRSRVLALAFAPDLKRAVTASKDGLLKIWNIDVRYHMDEDPKVLLSAGLSLPPGQVYTRLAWGPDNYIAGICGSLVHIIDARSGEVVERIDDAHSGQVTCLEWAPVKLPTPAGRVSVLATGGADHRVRLWRGPQPLV